MLAAISKILSFALTQQVFLSFYNAVDKIEKICNINFFSILFEEIYWGVGGCKFVEF